MPEIPRSVSALQLVRSAVNFARNLRTDGWENVISGLGTSRDRTTHGQFKRDPRIPDVTLASLYRTSLGNRICRAVPKGAFRRGIEIEGDEETEEQLRTRADELGVCDAFERAGTLAQAYGGALIVLGADDGSDLSEPLNLDTLQNIRHLTVIDRRYARASSYFDSEEDQNSADYGKPKLYSLYARAQPGSRSQYAYAEVHSSRTIRFDGTPTDDETRLENDGWDDSILQTLHNDLRDYEEAWRSSLNLLGAASQGVFRLKGLLGLLQTGAGREAAQTRVEFLDMMRSISRSIVLDADQNESYTRDNANFSGIPDLISASMQRISASTEIPYSVLFGRTQGGMSASGESDLTTFDNHISAEREKRYLPGLRRLFKLFCASKELAISPEKAKKIEICFPPLSIPTDKQKADTDYIKAQTDGLLIDKEIFLPEEIALSRSYGVDFDRSVRERVLKSEYKTYAEPPPPPPVPQQPPGTPPPPPGAPPPVPPKGKP